MPAANQQVNDTFLVSLRKATALRHQQLETTKLSKAILKDEVLLDDYINYLKKMSAVIAFCELTIFPMLKPAIPAIDERKKLQLIRNDLKYFGYQLPTDTFKPLDKNFSTGFALGYMYVIEGSTLGGRVILKHINDRLGINEKNGGSFFAGYGVTTGSKWKSFIELLGDYEKQCNCGNEIIEGAMHAFEKIYIFFEQ